MANAESLIHERGSVAVVAHEDLFTRAEKDDLRESSVLVKAGDYFVLLIQEDHTAEADEPESDEPTLADLEALTVPQLRELAAKDQLDIVGLTLKADLVGRLAAHFGINV